MYCAYPGVCVWERERGREGGTEGGREREIKIGLPYNRRSLEADEF